MKQLLQKSAEPQSVAKILIAILFSAIALLGGFSDLVYVPLGAHKTIDITITAVMFAAMIGGYTVAIPIALLWSIIAHYNDDHLFTMWPLWAMIISREIFTISIVWSYNRFRHIYQQSPWNVYRAIVVSIIIKNLVAIPFDMIYEPQGWLIYRGQQFVIEAGICAVFMSLLIKHLRTIHILNGVRKKEKGMKVNGN